MSQARAALTTQARISRAATNATPTTPPREERAKTPTPRELADRAALGLLDQLGAARRRIAQADALGGSDDEAAGEAWALGDALQAIALERDAAHAERLNK